MSAPVLERSGCGCTLKTGTIVIGSLQALAGFSMMVSEALAAYRGPSSAPPSSAAPPSPSWAPAGAVQGQRALCAALSVAGALQLVLSVLLLYGADYESPRLVKPWLLFSMALTAAVVAVYLGLAVLTFAAPGHRKLGYAVLAGILATVAVSTYFILVVHSFYRQLILQRAPTPVLL